MRYEIIEGVNIIQPLEMDSDIYDKIILKLETETHIKFKYYQNNYVIKRIKSRINSLNLSSDGAYYDYLKNHPDEIDLFLDNFTINYSYFFRNFNVFQEIKKLIENAGLTQQDTIRIWSCPCASGEEPYSLAILFEELKNDKKNFPNYEIIGSDINPNAIKKARLGIYGEHALSEIPEKIKKKYFERLSESSLKYKLIKKIRTKVRFINEDITLGHQKSQKYDIILCRNFIIYIDNIYRKELLKNLKMVLKEQGILILGKTEKIRQDNALEIIDPINQFYIHNSENVNDKYTYKSLLFKKNEQKRISKPLNLKLQSREFKTREKSNKKHLQTRKTKKQIEQKREKKNDKNENDNKNSIKLIKPNKAKVKNDKIVELELESEPNKTTYTLNEFNDKFANQKIKGSQEKLEIQGESSEQIQENLKKLKEKIDKEIFYLDQQRDDLNNKISIFQKKQKDFQLEKEQFIRKKLFFEQQKKQYEKELKWFQKQKNQFEIKRERFKVKRIQFLKEKRKFESRLHNNKKNNDNIKKFEEKKRSLKEYILPLGSHILLSQNDNRLGIGLLSLYGLGSSYVLILVDSVIKVYSMAHILFSKPKNKIQMPEEVSAIEKPHQYASLCVPYLIKRMLVKGASEKMISAYIIGGAQLFNKKYESIMETYNILKEKLSAYNIELLNSDIGGKSRRMIKYNLNEEKLYLRTEDEKSFKPL